jgi:class 3 adenylate cyclase/tetratricopeptide (TPR) repeat protein
MQCPRCEHENPQQAKFCLECGARLALTCGKCQVDLPGSAKFCLECGEPVALKILTRSPESYTPKHLAEKILTARGVLEDERKQVTVLFADMKGSMELLADRDPEEARKLLDPVLEQMMEAVHRYEGTVNQVMGDGIMALFGAPLAHEDHAVRACYAALRMQGAVNKYAEGIWRSEGIRVQIRVGINSGEVVVRSIGSDLHMDYTAVGQTTHLAGRLEQMADPGAILLTPHTLRLVEGFVQVQSLGMVTVKGLGIPAEIFELTGASPMRSRLQAAMARGLTTFVGRNVEMDTLFTALEQAKAGKGQVVAVVGEPGVGKSRLFLEFTHSPQSQRCLVLAAASVSYGKATPYLPVIDLLTGYFQIEIRDDTRKIREKVTGKLFSVDRKLESCLAPLLWVLDVPAEDTEWEGLDPRLRRQRLLDGLRRVLLHESLVQPLVLIFEDLHWIDHETQTILDQLVEGLPSARLLLLVNYRAEYSHGWGSKTYYRQLRIDPLSAPNAEQLLGTLLGDDPSVTALRPALIARTEGNPFFLEESVRSLVETGALTGERGAYRLTKAPDALQIRATAQTILAARIDRLVPEDKRLLQTAAVIGKDVPVVLLQALADMDETALQTGLARLRASEFLYEVPLFPEAEYTFKHALTHEVTYKTLLGARRRMLHARLVAAIERLHAGRLGEQVDRLVHHAQGGEVWDKAVMYGQQAGARALARGDLSLATASFEAALAAVAHLLPSHETQALAIDLTLGLRAALTDAGELNRGLDTAQRAVMLAEALGDSERLARATAGLMTARLVTGDPAGAAALGERALVVADAQGNGAQVELRIYLAQVYLLLGDYRRAIALAERSRQVIGLDATSPLWVSGAGPHAGVHAAVVLAGALATVGDFIRATAIAEEAAHLSMGHDTVLSRLRVLIALSTPALMRGEHKTAIPWLERGLALTRELNFLIWLPSFTGLLGLAYARIGRVSEGLGLLEEATIQAETRNRSLRVSLAYWQSQALLLAGQPDSARSVAQRGLEGARAGGERGNEASCLAVLGEAEAGGDPPDAEAARTHVQEAMELATELGMRPLVARCHLGLGKLAQRAGEREKAQEHFTAAATMYRDMDIRFRLEQAEAEATRLR